MIRIRLSRAVATAVTLCLAATGALAQGQWPTKPVRVLLGVSPGGFTDTVLRPIAPKLSEAFGQQFTIENRAGASGTIAVEAAMKAAPDGYTLLFCSNAEMTVNPNVLAKINYDPQRDFVPIVSAAIGPLVFATHPASPVKSIAELVAAAKVKPDAVAYASAGNGTLNHLAGEWLGSLAGVRLVHVPYKGGGPATADVLAGQVPIGVLAAAAAMPHIKSGRIRALAVTTAKRVSFAPDLPTVAELGHAGFDVSLWAGFFAPLGIAPEIVQRLNAEMNRALAQPDVRERLAAIGTDPLGGTPADLANLLRADLTRYGRVARENNIRAD